MTFGLSRAVLTGAAIPFAGGVAVAAAIVGALLVVEVGDQVLHLLFRRRPEARWPSLYRRAKPAIRALAVSIAGFESVRLAPFGWRSGLADLARVAVIASVAWIAIRATPLLEDLAARRFDVAVADNRRARRARTQLRVVRRVVTAIIVVVAVLAMVTSIPQARTLGASLFASAGVIGIVAGIAGQSTLGNVIAGIQVAFSDRLRIDDLVVVDGEFGTVEEITLTYVVVQIWDQRRLVLPVSHFVTTSFENWTRTQAQLIGSVYLYVDYRVPVEELRRELEAAVRAHPLWDRRVDHLAGRRRHRAHPAASGSGFRLVGRGRMEPALRSSRAPGELRARALSVVPSPSPRRAGLDAQRARWAGHRSRRADVARLGPDSVWGRRLAHGAFGRSSG